MHSKKFSRILIAAPKSGSGKTLITCGLLNLLKRKKYNVTSFKCGPDYIDPMFHRKVLGINGGNLDSFFQDRDGIRKALFNSGVEYAVIEGVMGIYDGLELSSSKASAYDIASITDTPIILVIDGKGAGRTLISSIKGILIDDEKALISGIIINNISKQYFDKLSPILSDELVKVNPNVKILGCLPHIKDISIDSRHLGLMLPEEICDLNKQIDCISDAIETNCNVDDILAIMNEASEINVTASGVIAEQEADKCFEIGRQTAKNTPIRLAVARDDAFCFYYKENLELLTNKGVELVPFSPIKDGKLPENISGILLGGGYPENHLEALSNNKNLLLEIKEKLQNGLPCLAECGGFMYLHNSVSDINGKSYKMVGAIDGECTYTGHLVRFGYIELNSETSEIEYEAYNTSNLINDEVATLSKHVKNMKAHEFHYYDSTCNGDALLATKPAKDIQKDIKKRSWRAGISTENSLMGFPHLYYPSNPQFVDVFIGKMYEYNL